MMMSRKKLLAVLGELRQERRRRLRRLTRDHELAVGSVSVVARKCGNPTCRCASVSMVPESRVNLVKSAFLPRDCSPVV